MRGPVIPRRLVLAGGAALAGGGGARAQPSKLTVTAPGGRAVEVTVWPAVGREHGLIQFSHGAASSPAKYAALIGPWTRAGFKVIAPLHPDSPEHRDHRRLDPADGWLYRLEDMRASAQLDDRPDYIAAGHSWGAQTALVLGGAQAVRPPRLAGPVVAHLAKAVVAFSPPPPYPSLVTREGYGALAAPVLIQTGTRDDLPAFLGGGDFHRHLIAYDAARGPDVYALVLDGVDHTFGGLICTLDAPGLPQTAQLDLATALSIDFLDAFGAGDGAARRRLDAQVTPGGGELGLHRR